MRWFWITALATLLLVGCGEREDPEKVTENKLNEIRNIVRMDYESGDGVSNYWSVQYEENGYIRTILFTGDSPILVSDENRAVYTDAYGIHRAKVWVELGIVKGIK
jgi:hypothetical protein